MNEIIPVQIDDKINFLKDQINKTHRQVANSSNYNYRINFIQYIDCAIQSLKTINRKDNNSMLKSTSNSKQINRFYSNQRQKLQLQKAISEKKIQQINLQEVHLELKKLKVELDYQKLDNTKQKKQFDDNLRDKQVQYQILIQKNKKQRNQLERLGKINIYQSKQIDKLKQERNRTQKQLISFKDQHDQQKKGSKSIQRMLKSKLYSTKGVIVKKVFINSVEGKQSEQFVTCQMPFILEVNKIVYGIKIAIQTKQSQVVYLNELQLFQKEKVQFTFKNNIIKVHYLKRNKFIEIDQYSLNRPEAFIMLFGKGDSINIYDSQNEV